MRTVAELASLQNQTVLLRADFNVPLDGQRITDDGRIRAAVPTIELLLGKGARIAIVAHLGRPKGEVDSKFSLAPVAKRLGEIIGKDVALCANADEVKKSLAEVSILENIRFDARETSKDDGERHALAEELAELGDIFVSDGFGVVHRKQASVYDVAKILPAYAGLLVQKEVDALSKVTHDPEHPVCVILGGSKVSDKIGVIDNMMNLADTILIGGGMTYTFFKALGYGIGQSLLEEDQIETAKKIIENADLKGVKLILPVDNIVTKDFAPASSGKIVKADEIPDELQALDVGPETVDVFAGHIRDAKTIVWNGPVGVFEFEHFQGGTRGVAEALAEATKNGAFSLIGGGDSAAAVRQFGYSDDSFSHISTGGGASLEFLEGKQLPGLEVLN